MLWFEVLTLQLPWQNKSFVARFDVYKQPISQSFSVVVSIDQILIH